MLQLILVPTDGSEASGDAAALALRLARAHGGSVLFCQAVDLVDAVDAGPQALEALNEAADAVLEAAVADARAHAVAAGAERLMGFATAAIVEYAHTQKVDAIVMGAHSKRPLQRFFLGSTTEGVIRHARLPVFVTRGPLPPRPAEAPAFEHILVAVDDSEPSAAAAAFAGTFAAAENARLDARSCRPRRCGHGRGQRGRGAAPHDRVRARSRARSAHRRDGDRLRRTGRSVARCRGRTRRGPDRDRDARPRRARAPAARERRRRGDPPDPDPRRRGARAAGLGIGSAMRAAPFRAAPFRCASKACPATHVPRRLQETRCSPMRTTRG